MACKFGRSYQIKLGETLSIVAQRELGDGTRWKEILKPDGTSFTENEAASLQIGQEVCIPQRVEPKPEKNELDYGKRRVIGYYENWGQWRKEGYSFFPRDIDPALFTHINFAFALFGFITKPFDFNNPRLTGDYKVRPIEENDISVLYPQLQLLKSINPELRTLISLGGWSFNDPMDMDEESPIGVHTYRLFSEMISSRSNRQQFIQSIIDFSHSHRFNGIDLDWEYPGTLNRGGQASDFENYLLLLKELRESIDSDPRGRLFLTVASPAIVPDSTAPSFREPNKYFGWWADCAKYLDWLNVMTYDYHGAFDKPNIPGVNGITGVNAPLYRDSTPGGDFYVSKTLDAYIRAGIPREKLVLGLPTYGRSHILASPPTGLVGPGQAFTGEGDAGPSTGTPGFLAYYEIANGIRSGTLQRGWDERTSTPYAYNPSTGLWITYDDEESLRLKSQYAGQENLGGIMVWAIGLDDFKSGFPLIRAASQAFFDTIPDFDLDDLPSTKGDEIIESGYSPAIAVNENGVVVQAFVHDSILYTQVGKHTDEGIVWAARQEVDKVISSFPRPTSLAVSDGGYVVVAFLGKGVDEIGGFGDFDNHELLFRMGKVEGYTIVWLSPTTKYGVGENPSIALSNDNKFFEVHQAGGWDSSHYLHYHTGEIENGQLKVSPSSGRYDNGKDPAIAVMTLASGKNILVEVHCSERSNNALWSRIGIVSGTEIQWGTSFRQEAEGIEDGGVSPSVAITKDGNVIEVHKSDKHGELWYKVGEFSEQEGKINWKNKAFHYDNGNTPNIALVGTKDSYILVETHAGDDGDSRVYSKASIPIAHRLVGELSFLESVGIDLESHVVYLDEQTDEWKRDEKEVPPSQGKQAWEKFKLLIMFVPFVPDIISITENSLEYDRGDTSVAPEIVLDSVFLGIDIFPVGKLAKGTAKSVVAIFKSITKVSKRFPLDEVLGFFRKRNLGPLSDWFKRHPHRFDEIKYDIKVCEVVGKLSETPAKMQSQARSPVTKGSKCFLPELVEKINKFDISRKKIKDAIKSYDYDGVSELLETIEFSINTTRRAENRFIQKLENYSPDLKSHRPLGGAQYPVELSRHHIIPWKKLAKFWNKMDELGHLYNTRNVSGKFLTEFSRNIREYEWDRASLEQAAKVIDTIREKKFLDSPIETSDAERFAEVFEWMPGNLFIGPKELAPDATRPSLYVRVDGPGDNFDGKARNIISRNYFSALEAANESIDKYLNSANLQEAGKALNNLGKIIGVKEPYKLKPKDWNFDEQKKVYSIVIKE